MWQQIIEPLEANFWIFFPDWKDSILITVLVYVIWLSAVSFRNHSLWRFSRKVLDLKKFLHFKLALCACKDKAIVDFFSLQ